jgi:hypothetical protein
MLRFLPLLLVLTTAPLVAQSGYSNPALNGRIEGNTYISPTGTFSVVIPVLPELGGRIVDTEAAVTFQDDFNVFATIAAFPLDTTQRWELATRGKKDYLVYFFGNFVMPDFQRAFAGASVEEAKYAPSIMDGSLLAYLLLPGGSMFAHKLAFLPAGPAGAVAKRGNLIVTRDNWIFIISTELAERVVEGASYQKTPAEEDDILRGRLVELLAKMRFTPPPKPAP